MSTGRNFIFILFTVVFILIQGARSVNQDDSMLFLMDLNAVFDSGYRRSLSINIDDSVLIGEYMNTSRSTTYYVEVSNEIEVGLSYRRQLQSALDGLTDTYPTVRTMILTAHHGNNGLQRRLTKRASSHKLGHLTATLKYGANESIGAITDFVLGSASNLMNGRLSDVIYGDKGSAECIEVTEVLPIGRTWYWGGVTGIFGSWLTNGNKCNTKASESQIQQVASWVDSTIDKYPYHRDYTIRLSNEGATDY